MIAVWICAELSCTYKQNLAQNFCARKKADSFPKTTENTNQTEERGKKIHRTFHIYLSDKVAATSTDFRPIRWKIIRSRPSVVNVDIRTFPSCRSVLRGAFYIIQPASQPTLPSSASVARSHPIETQFHLYLPNKCTHIQILKCKSFKNCYYYSSAKCSHFNIFPERAEAAAIAIHSGRRQSIYLIWCLYFCLWTRQSETTITQEYDLYDEERTREMKKRQRIIIKRRMSETFASLFIIVVHKSASIFFFSCCFHFFTYIFEWERRWGTMGRVSTLHILLGWNEMLNITPPSIYSY